MFTNQYITALRYYSNQKQYHESNELNYGDLKTCNNNIFALDKYSVDRHLRKTKNNSIRIS